ncbi:MAG TPA: hypothetical protein VHE37_02435, partial [Nevskiaceae bacterium]|nr:hypothetical protein [Nevskiaceae bacterium]
MRSDPVFVRPFLLMLPVLLASCGGGGGGGDSAGLGSGGGSSGGTGICNALNGYLTTDSSAAGMVTGYSFAVFSKSNILLTCAGGDQQIGAIRAIASASKLPSAAAIMTLVDSGSLNLDLPVSVYLLGSGVN